MNRIKELVDKYPEIPQEVVIGIDLARERIKPNPLMQEVKARTLFLGEAEREVQIEFSDKSPYEIKKSSSNELTLCRDNAPLISVIFPKLHEWYFKKTKSGTPMSSILYTGHSNRMLSASAFNYCQYVNTGDSCKYCALVSGIEMAKKLGEQRKVHLKVDDLVEAFSEAIEENKDIESIYLAGGALIDQDKEAQMYIPYFSALNKIKQQNHLDISLVLCSTAYDKKLAQKLKEVGVNKVLWNIEVWDEEMFKIICPGKSKFVGRENWLMHLREAVEVFGVGNVCCNFVGGFECAWDSEFRDLEDAVKSSAKGFEWLLENGIVPGFSFFFGTNIPDSPCSKLTPPPTEYYLELALQRHDLMLKYGMEDPTVACYKW